MAMNDRRAARLNLTDHLSRMHDFPLRFRGIVEHVDIHSQMAIVAIQGGDPAENVIEDVEVVDLTNGEVIRDESTQNLGSYYTRYPVKIPSTLAMGLGGLSGGIMPLVHCTVAFDRTMTKPVIESFEIDLDRDGTEDVHILIDHSTTGPDKGIRVYKGGEETTLAKALGVPGYRSAPWSQNPEGAAVLVSGANVVKRIIRAKDRGPKALKEAMTPSTPSGIVAGWRDSRGEQGLLMAFGDEINQFAKEHSSGTMGSSQPESTALKNPMLELAEAFGIAQKNDPVPTKMAADPRWQVGPAAVALAIAELGLWKATSAGFAALPEMTEGLYSVTGTGTADLGAWLKTAPEGTLIHPVAAALAAGSFSLSTGTVLNGGDVFSGEPAAQAFPEGGFDPGETREAFRASLAGTAAAWVAMACAVRLSILHSSKASQLAAGLGSAPLELTHKASGGTSALRVPNLFGFPAGNVGVDGLKGSTAVRVALRDTFRNEAVFTTPEPSRDGFSYGDLVHANLLALRQEAQAWASNRAGIQDLFVPNRGAVKAVAASETFLDRVYLSAELDAIPASSRGLSLEMGFSWSAGLYAAQVRTLLQEIWLMAEQYSEDLSAAGIPPGNLPTLGPVLRTTVLDDHGDSHALWTRGWTAPFVGYLAIRLFTGRAGREAARAVLKTDPEKLSSLTERDFGAIIEGRTPASGDGLTGIWWSTMTDRMTLLADTLSQSGHLMRTF